MSSEASAANVVGEVAPAARAGLSLHWLKPRSKAPLKAAWPSEPVYSVAELRRSYRAGVNVGVRLGEPSQVGDLHLYLIDLDIRDPTCADEARAALREFLPTFTAAPTVRSGSGGESRHFYFFSDGLFRSKKLAHSADKMQGGDGRWHWTWEIELFGTGKQAVFPPSIHPDTGRPYVWERPLDFEAVELGLCDPFVPAAIVQAWGVGGAERADSEDDDWLTEVRAQPLALTEADITDTLAALPLDTWCEDRDGWLKVGMALHHQYEGSAGGLARWHAFSAQSPKYDPKDLERVWRSFDTKPNGVRFPTLLKAAREAKPGPVKPRGPGGDIQWGRDFAAAHRGRFLHVRMTGMWRRWDKVRWAPCALGEEVEAAKDFAGDALEQGAGEYRRNPTAENGARLREAETLFRSAAKVRAMLDMAATEPGIVTSPDAFDADPMLLGVRNGVLDLRKGHLIAPDPRQMIARQSKAAFQDGAVSPLWSDFLARVQPDPDVRAFLQRAVGYTLTGSVDEECFFFAYGTGANGKSVFANVIAALLGEFTETVGPKLLTKSFNSSEADRLVAKLPGARLALANETGQGDIWDDQRLKEITSREEISARELYKAAFSFMPTHKLWIRGNHLPGAHDASHGFWRRLVTVPFTVQIPLEERVPDLDRRIIAEELSGVLNWAVAGCLEWQRSGLAVPAVLRREVEEYRADTDSLGRWLEERTEADPNARTLIGDAFADYRDFCREQNHSAPSMPVFSRQMAARGLAVAGSRKQGRRIPGLKLRGLETEDDDGLNR